MQQVHARRRQVIIFSYHAQYVYNGRLVNCAAYLFFVIVHLQEACCVFLCEI